MEWIEWNDCRVGTVQQSAHASVLAHVSTSSGRQSSSPQSSRGALVAGSNTATTHHPSHRLSTCALVEDGMVPRDGGADDPLGSCQAAAAAL